ncbi:MAG: AMP-dependent synthetase/ligase [Nocardioidaceae bacterium]
MVATSQEQDLLVNRPESLGRLFFDRVLATPDRDAYSFPAGDDGDWTTVTWAETGDRVSRIVAGLVALGVQPEQRVAIAAGTSYEWILADLAILSCGAATTTIYPSSLADDVAFILGDSESRVVFAEDDQQIAKIREHRARLPALVKVVTFTGTSDGDWVLALEDLEAAGQALLDADPNVVVDRVEATRRDQLATLIYTSGTTGRPKGVRLPHAAWTYEGVGVQALDILSADDVQFLWLPLAHSFGKVLLSAQLAVGFPTAVDGRVEKIIDNLAVVRPTFMGAAPRIFEKAHGRIVTMAASDGGAKKKFFDRAFVVGLDVERRRAAGTPVPRHLALQHALFDRLVFSKIRARFGGRLRFFISGAAALSQDVAEWFNAAGILILEGYGLTETSAGTCVNRPDSYRFGTVGLPFDGTEIKVAADGELLIKGPGVMDGYHGQAAATAEALHDGWFSTGDIGEVDADGFVRVTDRKKDLIKTSGGKYVAPQVLEGQFKAVCPYASQFFVHGNERSFVTALVTLDTDAMGGWISEHGLDGASYAEIVGSDAAQEMVQGYVDQLNARLNKWETVKRFVVLERDLSVEDGEITPSMKVKRKVVEEHYRERLDALYR